MPVQNDASQKMLLPREKTKVTFFPDDGGRTGPLERARVQQSRNRIVRIDCGDVSGEGESKEEGGGYTLVRRRMLLERIMESSWFVLRRYICTPIV